MVATVLNSPRAVQMSVFVVRAFVKMRETLTQDRQLAAMLADLEKRLTDRLDIHDKALVFILDELKKLQGPVPDSHHKEIGIHIREVSTPYKAHRKPETAKH